MQPDVDDKTTEVEEDEEFEGAASDATVVMSDESFEEGDVPTEANIDSLVKEMDRPMEDDLARKQEVRRKLEELAEEQGFDSTYAIDDD